MASDQLLFAALIFVLAGLVKGVVGMGLPTVSMGLLGALMAPAQAAALVVVPSLVTNVWQLRAGPYFAALAHRLWPMMAGVVIGTWAGSGLLLGPHTRLAKLCLGLVLVAYALSAFIPRPVSIAPSTERWLGPLVGALTGLISGGTGVFVIPAVPYLQALDLDKEALIQALGLSFTVSTLALGLCLLASGTLQATNFTGSALALVPALAGMGVGTLVRHRLSAARFKRVFLSGLFALGLYLVLHSL